MILRLHELLTRLGMRGRRPLQSAVSFNNDKYILYKKNKQIDDISTNMIAYISTYLHI